MQGSAINKRRMLTAAMAAMTLAVPFAGVAFADEERGKGDERPQTTPGQEKKAENAAPQSDGSATSGNGYGAGKSEKPAKPARPAKPAKRAKPAKPAKPAAKPAKPAAKPAKPANTHAKAGKTTICHATGSDKNPFVTITVSNNALKAHARHQDGDDIIPAPAGGCPKGEEKAAAPKGKDQAKAGRAQAKVTICHATGSDSNPYVKITIAEPAVEAHRRHQDGEDIIPAPEGDCPAPAAAAAAAGSAKGAPAPAASGSVRGAQAAAALLPAPAAALVAPPKGGVLGATAEGGAGPDAAVAGDTARRETGADVSASLPFTGLDTWLLVVLGLGAILAGVAMRRSATSHR